MSTRLDIIRAKAAFDDHVSAHKCRSAGFLDAGERPCEERVALWLDYQDTAGRWGTEAGDAQRVTEQYAAQSASISQAA
jgi:hypothetical protein